jgi:hypothetical protein
MRLIFSRCFLMLLTSLLPVSSIHAAVHERQKLARNPPRPATSGCRMSKVLTLRGGCDGVLSAAPLPRRSLSAGSLSPCRYAAEGSISCIPPCHQWRGVQWETQTVVPWQWASCFSDEEDDDEVVVIERGEWWMRAFCCFFCGQWQLISARRRARLKESEREQEAVREIARLFGKVFTIEDELDLSAMMRGAQEGVSRGFNEVRAETLAKIESFLNLPSGYRTGLVGGLVVAISATLGNASLALFPERQAAASVAGAPADGALQRTDDSILHCGSNSRLCDWVPAASSNQQVPLMRQSLADAGLLHESLSLSIIEKECELRARGEASTSSAGSAQKNVSRSEGGGLEVGTGGTECSGSGSTSRASGSCYSIANQLLPAPPPPFQSLTPSHLKTDADLVVSSSSSSSSSSSGSGGTSSAAESCGAEHTHIANIPPHHILQELAKAVPPPQSVTAPPPPTHIVSIPPHHILQELAKAAGLLLSNLHKWCLARGSGAPQLPANPAANKTKNATPSTPSSSIAAAEQHSARSRPLLLRGQWLLWGKWSGRWPRSNASAGNDRFVLSLLALLAQKYRC